MLLEKEFIVEKKHSAAEVGSGDLEVLSTPAMIAFMENVAKVVIEKKLAAGQTTVGIELNVQHLKATAIGKKIKVKALLTEQKKNILFYEVTAHEGDTLIGKGKHTRAIVETDTFLEQL